MKMSLVTTAFMLAVVQGVSSAAEPTTAGCLSAHEASLKLRSDHKLRAERSQLLGCAASTCPADIRKECLARVEEVNAQIPTIVFSGKDGSGADIGVVKVTMDGEVLTERLEGTALSVDPGEHAFTFETAGQATLTKKILVLQGQKDRHELIAFSATQPTDSVPSPSPSGTGTQKVLALVAGGIGLAGLGVGAAFGFMAISQKNDAQSACPDACRTTGDQDKWSTAGKTGDISTIAFVVGGVGVAGAALLWFTAGNAGPSSPQVGLGLGGLQARGTW
jgi:hypothetical protein